MIKKLIFNLTNNNILLLMNSTYGFLYIRCSKTYDLYNACKLGIASNIPDRDSVYSTGEIEHGFFELVFEVKKGQMRIIENLLKIEFNKFNIKYDSGTEFYNKEIINIIELTINKFNILYRILTKDEIDNLERCNRSKKIIANAIKKINIRKFIERLKLIKHNKLNRYIECIKKRNSIKELMKNNLFDILHMKINNDDIDYLQRSLIDDQIEILLTSIVYYQFYNKGIWNLFCRYGKTRLSCLFCKIQKYKKILVLVPSIYLINQTYNTWKDFFPSDNILKICCEEKNSNFDDFYNNNDTCIFISTYHSSEKTETFNFDICVYDEAHRTTGLKENNKTITEQSFFKTQLENKNITNKLFLTATIKEYTGGENTYYTMDDENIYGKIIATVSAKKARELGRICNYKIITIELKPLIIDIDIENFIKNNNIIEKREIDNLNLIKNKYLMCAEGLFQTMEKEQIKHVITFHELIINCKLFKIIFEKVCRKHKKRYNIINIDGKTPNREHIIQNFQDIDYSLLCSAKVLQEGVDIPKCDGVIFIDIKTSIVDTIQSLSRCLTKCSEKNGIDIIEKEGHVMIPYDDKTDLLNDEYTNNLRLVLRNIIEIDDNLKAFFKELLTFDFDDMSDNNYKILDVLKIQYNVNVNSKIIKNLREISYVTYYEAKELIKGKYTHENEYKNKVKIDFTDVDKELPINANIVYNSFGWKSWTDYMGLENSNEITYDKARKIITQYPNIKNKQEYYDLCARDERLPLKPEEKFNGSFDWIHYLSIERIYYDLELCKKKVNEYLLVIPEIKKHYLNLSLVCAELCKIDMLFPPNGLWVEYYQMKELCNIIKIINIKKKTVVLYKNN